MTKLPLALCLSASLVALGLAGFALSQNQAGTGGDGTSTATAEEVRELRDMLVSLQESVANLELQRSGIVVRGVRPKHGRGGEPGIGGIEGAESELGGEPVTLEDRVVALTERLSSLEDGETIARLAKAGEQRVRSRRIKSSIEALFSEEADPKERLNAFRQLRKTDGGAVKEALAAGDMEYWDMAMPILENARNKDLDTEFRMENLREISWMKSKDMREPLMELAYDDSPEIRAQSVRAMMPHIDDVRVQEAILRVSREDPSEEVRGTALRRVPRVAHFAREHTPDSAAAQVDAKAAEEASRHASVELNAGNRDPRRSK